MKKLLEKAARVCAVPFGVLALGLAASACSHESGGPVVQTMTLEIENEAGKVDRSCLSLPVLVGSISSQKIEVDGTLEVTTLATNDDVELSYTGGAPFKDRYAIEDIEYQEWPLVAEGNDQTFLITLRLGCSGAQ